MGNTLYVYQAKYIIINWVSLNYMTVHIEVSVSVTGCFTKCQILFRPCKWHANLKVTYLSDIWYSMLSGAILVVVTVVKSAGKCRWPDDV